MSLKISLLSLNIRTLRAHEHTTKTMSISGAVVLALWNLMHSFVSEMVIKLQIFFYIKLLNI